VGALLEMAPTLLLLAGTYWLISRQVRQMTGGFPGGMGGAGRGAQGGKGGGGAGGLFGMMRANTATLDKASKEKMTFKDVAGCDEAKAEIMEFVEFLVGQLVLLVLKTKFQHFNWTCSSCCLLHLVSALLLLRLSVSPSTPFCATC
jgi:hypothetical protein